MPFRRPLPGGFGDPRANGMLSHATLARLPRLWARGARAGHGCTSMLCHGPPDALDSFGRPRPRAQSTAIPASRVFLPPGAPYRRGLTGSSPFCLCPTSGRLHSLFPPLGKHPITRARVLRTKSKDPMMRARTGSENAFGRPPLASPFLWAVPKCQFGLARRLRARAYVFGLCGLLERLHDARAHRARVPLRECGTHKAHCPPFPP
jgi:hypothetical protein